MKDKQEKTKDKIYVTILFDITSMFTPMKAHNK